MKIPQPLHIGIVGGGYAGHHVLWALLQLLQKKSQQPIHITWWHEQNLAPAASFSSTSLVALQGARPHTPRGDLLLAAFKATTEFIHSQKPEGVRAHSLISLCQSGGEEETRLRRRYNHLNFWPHHPQVLFHEEEAYQIDNEIFLGWLREKILHLSQLLSPRVILHERRSLVVSCQQLPTETETDANANAGYLVTDHARFKCEVHKLILCPGAYTKIFFPLFTPPVAAEHKVVAGSYLRFPLPFPTPPLNASGINPWYLQYPLLNWQEINCIYRWQQQDLILGATTQETDIFAPPWSTLQEIYERFTLQWKDQFPLPPLHQAQVVTGMRHKGAKRLPFWGKMGPNLFGMHSLYKNGIMFSCWGGPILAQIVWDQSLSEHSR